MHLIFLPLAIILGTAKVVAPNTMPVLFPMLPLTVVLIKLAIGCSALAVKFAMLEVAIIHISISLFG